MSSDQVTYVLVAFLVAGLATLLLLVGALLARRGSRAARTAPESPSAARLASSVREAADVAVPAPALAGMSAALPAGVPAPVVGPASIAVGPAAEPTRVAVGPAPEPAPVRSPMPEPEPIPVLPEPPREEPIAVTAADLAAAARRVHDPREEEIIEGFLSISPRRRQVAADEAGRPPVATAPVPAGADVEETELAAEPAPAGVAPAEPAAGAERGPTVAPARAPAPSERDPYVDDLTGLDSRAAWDRVVAEESARYVRYRRPVSIVVGELDGLGRFEGQFGAEAARRVLWAVAAALRGGARRTDRVAHAGGGRFLVLMPETDEIQAINYVERVRGECERWLEAGSAALHVSLGWASPPAVGELDTAVRTAEERMYAERRRAARAGSGDPGASR